MNTRDLFNKAATDTGDGERRLHARHLTRLRVQLIRNDTLPMVVKTAELSEGGMHVEADRATTQLLAPPAADGPARPFTARIIPPPEESAAKPMTVQVEVANVVELDPDRYRVGLRFTRFFGKSRELLGRYIDSLAEAG